jgi:hypothetical protein
VEANVPVSPTLLALYEPPKTQVPSYFRWFVSRSSKLWFRNLDMSQNEEDCPRKEGIKPVGRKLA